MCEHFRKDRLIDFFLVLPLLAYSQDDPAEFKAAPSSDIIARWVQGRDPRQMAWAAVFALKEKDTSFLPEFASLARQWQPLPHQNVLERDHPEPPLTSEERERRDAMSAMLDAIIQLNGSVPAESIQNLAGDFPAQAIILLYRTPPQEAESALLALYNETAPASWYTQRSAASLLALHPPAGFAASLFSNITVTSHLFVSLPEDPSFGRGVSSGACVNGGQLPIKANWPEVGKYLLREGGSVRVPEPYLTIPGLRPIDVVRVVAPTLQIDSGECTGFRPLNNAIRTALIAQMLGKQPDQMAFQSQDNGNLKVQNGQDYQTQLVTYVDHEQVKLHEVKSELTFKQLISSAEEADDAVLPSLLIVISDARSAQLFPLGQVLFRSTKVKVEAEHGAFYE